MSHLSSDLLTTDHVRPLNNYVNNLWSAPLIRYTILTLYKFVCMYVCMDDTHDVEAYKSLHLSSETESVDFSAVFVS